MAPQPYRQALPGLGLSLERATDSVPDDGHFHLCRAGEEIGRYRSLKAAQAAWQEVIRESGWKPQPREADPAEIRRREQTERWARNRAG